jgi:hypothetical protein
MMTPPSTSKNVLNFIYFTLVLVGATFGLAVALVIAGRP